MEALSTGFCVAALTQSLKPAGAQAWEQQWPQPTLQVVDIQRYPRCPTVASGQCRFYLAASDGQALVWLVVPPQTPLEEAIVAFELEVGCCVKLLSHTLVKAANGLNVVVPLQVRYSSNTLRLLGQPRCSYQLFPLSPNSLVQRSVEMTEATHAFNKSATASAAVVRRPLHRVDVHDFVDKPEKALGNWSITVRVVWRGQEYRMGTPARFFGSTVDSASAPRYVFRCLLVDEHGDGIVAAFSGGETLLDRVHLHDCLLLAQGTVKWGVGEVAGPVELQFMEKSIEGVMDAQTCSKALPFHASSLVGEVAQNLRSVSQVVTIVQIGDFTSVVGIVAAVQGSIQITTKRGRVWRSVVTLTDDTDGSKSKSNSSSNCYVEVTLWGDIAESVKPAVGERWVFHSCVVQLFQQRKTLTSRASTMAVQLRSPQLPEAEFSTLISSNFGETTSNTLDRTCPSVPVASDECGTAATVSSGFSHFSATAVNPIQCVLDLSEASTTVPALTRVMEVLSPLLTWTCTRCEALTEGISNENVDLIPERCSDCGCAELAPSFHLDVWLSDALSAAVVALHGSAAEALLETTPMELARALQCRPAISADLRSRLVGLPVLMWLLPDFVEESGVQHYIAATCKHVDYVSCSHTLLSAVDAYINTAGVEDAVSSSKE